MKTRVNLSAGLRAARVICFLVAVIPPLSYAMVSRNYLGNQIAFVSELQATRLSKVIYTEGTWWQYQRERMKEAIELDENQTAVTLQTIYNADGKPILTVGQGVGRLSMSRSYPLVVFGNTVGRVEVSIPLDMLAMQVAILGLLTTIIGFGAYLARAVPLRSLDRAIDRMQEVSNNLAKRTHQLSEAQTIGKMGDWSYDFGAPEVIWSDQIYALLGYGKTFSTTYENVMSLYVDDGAERILQAQSEGLNGGNMSAVDLEVKRGDGSTGHFAITTKARVDEAGKVRGIYGTIQDISTRKEAEKQLEQLAYHDPLTGLANRALFHRRINETIARCQSSGSSGALLLLDLDRFKDVNDTLGHSVGDALLVKVAHLLARSVGLEHFVARLGGDEFAVLVEGLSDNRGCEKIAGTIVELLSGNALLEQVEVAVGTSIGIARIVTHGSDVTDLLRNADLALYRAKEEGRGRYSVFEEGMDEIAQKKVTIARELRDAVIEDNKGLAVYYQPQVDLVSQRVSGYEALMRWNHPTLGFIPPSTFIPIAESSHLICDVGYWVLRTSILQAKQWLDAGGPSREIAINVSAAQIWSADLVGDVKRVLDETGFPAELVCLELTETLLVNQEESRAKSVLKGLKQSGIVLALDDFGTGFSSLGYLTQLPFDKIKIDRIFIDGVTRSERRIELLRGIIGLGEGLGMTTVAEGAERPEEVELLRELGCDVVQGFVYARPQPAEDAFSFALRQDGIAMKAAGKSTPDVLTLPVTQAGCV